MKILVLGASGLIGHNTCLSAIRRGHQVIAVENRAPVVADGVPHRLRLDLADSGAITREVIDLWPDVIINAAAISSPDACEADPVLAEKLNVRLPRLLAQLSTHLGARFLHLSTDLVFDGGGGAPFRSTDLPCPSTLYGQLKLMAEREVLEHNPEDPVVLRITLTMGNSPGGKRSVHEKLLHQIAGGERPKMATDELRQPVSAENVADVLVELAERRDLHGIFHWAGRETLSRYELARRILHSLGLPADWVEPYQRHPETASGTDWTFILPPLLGKLKTEPASVSSQLDEISVPVALQDWFHSVRNRSQP